MMRETALFVPQRRQGIPRVQQVIAHDCGTPMKLCVSSPVQVAHGRHVQSEGANHQFDRTSRSTERYVSRADQQMKIRKKFFFTQISAPIIGSGSMLLVAIWLGKHFPINRNLSSFRDWIYLGALFLTLFLSMYLWGRILVLLGILTKEEAKGYPYSKPWEKEDNLLQ